MKFSDFEHLKYYIDDHNYIVTAKHSNTTYTLTEVVNELFITDSSKTPSIHNDNLRHSDIAVCKHIRDWRIST